jgi:hypothetical protein
MGDMFIKLPKKDIQNMIEEGDVLVMRSIAD